MITGSAIGRLLACPSSAPGVYPHTAAPSTSYSEEGISLHAQAETAIDLDCLDELSPRLVELIANYPNRLTETVYSYDVATDTAEWHPSVRNRQYREAGPFEIFATLDLLAFSATTKSAVIVDHKLHADQGDPRKHGQLLTQALMVARAHGLSSITVAISYLPTGWVDSVTLDDLDLDAHAYALRELYKNVAAARKSPTEFLNQGPHCRYCPAFQSCPKQASMFALALSPTTASQMVERAIPIETAEDARRLYHAAAAMKVFAKRVTDCVAAFASETPFPIDDDGNYYGLIEKAGNESVDGRTAYDVAGDMLGPDAAISVVKLSATKKAIETAAKKAAPGKGVSGAALNRELLTEVRKRGGITRSEPSKSLGIFKPSEGPAVLQITDGESK